MATELMGGGLILSDRLCIEPGLVTRGTLTAARVTFGALGPCRVVRNYDRLTQKQRDHSAAVGHAYEVVVDDLPPIV